jgi:hypothetical protein
LITLVAAVIVAAFLAAAVIVAVAWWYSTGLAATVATGVCAGTVGVGAA